MMDAKSDAASRDWRGLSLGRGIAILECPHWSSISKDGSSDLMGRILTKLYHGLRRIFCSYSQMGKSIDFLGMSSFLGLVFDNGSPNPRFIFSPLVQMRPCFKLKHEMIELQH